MENRLLVSVRETARLLGVSVRTVHRYAQFGILKPVHVGRRKLFGVADIVRFSETGVSVERLRRIKAQLAQK